MRGLSFLKCADALLDVKVKDPNSAKSLKKFYDKAVEYIERAANMNKPETDKPGYREWEEFVAQIQICWAASLAGKLPQSYCDYPSAAALLREATDRAPTQRSDRIDAVAALVDADVFMSPVVGFIPIDDASTRVFFELYHTALENAKGRRESILRIMDHNAELDTITE